MHYPQHSSIIWGLYLRRPRSVHDWFAMLDLIDESVRKATASGALQPLSTRSLTVPDDGIDFIVRILSNIRRKASAGSPANPFLPYDPDLFVKDVSATHVCLLNKFNVLSRHLLIVTRDFEDQRVFGNDMALVDNDHPFTRQFHLVQNMAG